MAIPAEVVAKIRATPFEKLEKGWAWAVIRYGNAELAKADRFYLLCVLLHRKDAFRP